MEINNQVNSSVEITYTPQNRVSVFIPLILIALLNVFVSFCLFLIILSGGQVSFLLESGLIYRYIALYSSQVLFLLFLILEISLISWLIWILFKKKLQISFKTIFLVFLITSVFCIVGLKIFNQIKLEYERKKIETQNPIKQGVQNYDFTKPILINNNESVKNSITLENNKIVWLENLSSTNTRTNEDIWIPPQVFTFVFDDINSTGEIIQVSDNKNKDFESIRKDNVKMYDGVIYWIENPGTLMQYDPITKQRKSLANKYVQFIDNGYENNIFYEKSSDIHNNDSKLYSMDVKTGEISTPLALNLQTYGGSFFGQYICYYTINFKLGQANWQTKKMTEFDLPKPHSELYYGPSINQCNENFLGYSISLREVNFGKSIEWYKYDFNTKQNMLIKRLPTYSGNFQEGDGKVYNNMFYYMGSDRKVYAMDLTTKQEKVLVSSNTGEIWDWQTDGKYLVYTVNNNLPDDSYIRNSLFLLKLTQ